MIYLELYLFFWKMLVIYGAVQHQKLQVFVFYIFFTTTIIHCNLQPMKHAHYSYKYSKYIKEGMMRQMGVMLFAIEDYTRQLLYNTNGKKEYEIGRK